MAGQDVQDLAKIDPEFEAVGLYGSRNDLLVAYNP